MVECETAEWERELGEGHSAPRTADVQAAAGRRAWPWTVKGRDEDGNGTHPGIARQKPSRPAVCLRKRVPGAFRLASRFGGVGPGFLSSSTSRSVSWHAMHPRPGHLSETQSRCMVGSKT